MTAHTVIASAAKQSSGAPAGALKNEFGRRGDAALFYLARFARAGLPRRFAPRNDE
jgi:hypothetical protein